ncbi:LuxR C-terminal-related transcriptional regulator [Saccharothrix longispora]|uniref:ATP/maltotriose-dependent transcriptional regulator MalT n=1 Tax=Saccharothrix longispora TaxID=33920 RepID=A0ABU1PQS3_9PSEU|nr:LuxR C-terminal-related transcriptional regulator [Saccharothrix longispora]MDR6592990.1 ATP/maltotriose-dependent transcriptional regulator MalT [Saccharothrix longispora]
MLEEGIEPIALPPTTRLPVDEAVDEALAALARGEGGVLVVEQSGLLGRRAVVERVRAEAGARGVPVVHGRATRLDRVAPLSTLVVALGAGQAGLGDLDGNRMAALERLRSRLVRLSAGRGLLVSLDDFHHSDEFTALALRVLVPALASTPVLWLLSLRPPLASASVRGVVDALLADGARRLTPERLGEDAVRRLCEEAVGAEADAEVLALAAIADGQPDLVRGVVRALHAAGYVRVRAGRAEVVAGAEGLPLPDWLVAEVRSLLVDLPEPVTALLEAGAVLGRPFTVHEAAGLTRRPIGELVSAAGEAVEVGALVSGPRGLGFRSDLVRGVVYAGLAEPVRMALHREAADVVAEEGHSPDEVVHHVERGGRRGSPAVVEAVWRVVRSRAASAPQEAADLALKLLDLLGDGHPSAAGLTVEAVRLLTAGDRGREAWDLAVRALHRDLDAETETRLVCALAALADPAYARGDEHAVVEYARRALARPDLTEQHRAELGAVQAYRLAATGYPAAAREAAEEHPTRLGRGEALMLGSAAQGLVALHNGEFTRALELTRAAVREADRIGPVGWRRHPRLWLCPPLIALDRFEEVDSTLAVVERESRRLSTSWIEPEWRYHRARVRVARGALPDAEADAEVAVRTARARAARPLLAKALRLLAEARTARGDLAAARANLREVEQLGACDVDPAQLTWRRVLWLCAAGREDEAAEVAEGVLAAADLTAFMATATSPVAPVLFRLVRRRGDRRRAAQVVRTAQELGDRNPGVPWAAATAAHVRGLDRGELAAVVSAAELHRMTERRPAMAMALADAGELAHRAGDHERARELLAEAERTWVACDARPAARRARRVLSDLGGRGAGRAAVEDEVVPPPAPEQWANLTGTEVRVARLVARGLTNKAIASRLTLSPNTIGTHVRNAFTKLRVTNRVELALRVIAQDRGGLGGESG